MGKERRYFNRLSVSLPVRYAVPGGAEECSGLGVLKNISLSGLFFESPPPMKLEKGQVLEVRIAASLPSLNIQSVSHLEVKGEVVRLVRPTRSNASWGIAVRFADELTYAAPPAD
jgi:hypothetical protein